RLALVLCGEIVVLRLHVAAAKDRTRYLGERVREVYQRLFGSALDGRLVARIKVGRLRVVVRPAVAGDLAHRLLLLLPDLSCRRCAHAFEPTTECITRAR